MNSKYAKMALPGLVVGLALGFSVPAFAQDHHGDWHGGGGGSQHASDNHGGGNRGAPPPRGPQGGGHPQPGAMGGAPHGPPPPAGAGVQAHVAVGGGGAPGYRGDPRGDWHGGDAHRGDWHGGAAVHGGGHFDWHGDSRFNGYGGVHVGFYFAPGRGYYHVPQQWYGHHWGRGEFLPRFFFSYRIYDPDYYDLPYPPYGCAWMFVGEDAVLVNLDTGEVIDVIYGVF